LNRVVLEGRISKLGELRHTPGGVPIVEFRIVHASEQMENGRVRQVECEMDVIGIGDLGRGIAALGTGAAVCVTGFLARRSLKSEWPVLHATAVETAHGAAAVSGQTNEST
jgi:primosomal replication protein N